MTPEMRAAAEQAGLNCLRREDLYVDVYRAMHALAPVKFCPEDRIAALERERDEARQWRDCWKREHDIAVEQRDEAIGKFDIVCDDKKRLLFLNASLRAELAARPAPVPDTPNPAVVIREHRSDPRRLGLA